MTDLRITQMAMANGGLQLVVCRAIQSSQFLNR